MGTLAPLTANSAVGKRRRNWVSTVAAVGHAGHPPAVGQQQRQFRVEEPRRSLHFGQPLQTHGSRHGAAPIQIHASQEHGGFVSGLGVKVLPRDGRQTVQTRRRQGLLQVTLCLRAELQLVQFPALGRQRAQQPQGLTAETRLVQRLARLTQKEVLLNTWSGGGRCGRWGRWAL